MDTLEMVNRAEWMVEAGYTLDEIKSFAMMLIDTDIIDKGTAHLMWQFAKKKQEKLALIA